MSGELKILTEALGKTITMDELYPDGFERGEILNDFVTPSEMSIELPIKTMTAKEASKLEAPFSSENILDVYNDHATSSQKKLVKDKMKKFDKNRIVVIENKTVLDGNHHVIAAILSNNSIKYVDLMDTVEKE